MNWAIYGILAAVCFAAMTLTFKKILSLNVSPIALMFGVFTFGCVGYAILMRTTQTTLSPQIGVILLLLLAAVFAITGNLLDAKALSEAPNPGYVSGLKSAQILIVTIASLFLFNSPLTLPKGIGLALVIAGVLFISLG